MKVNAPLPLFSTIDRVRSGDSAGDAPKRERGQGNERSGDENASNGNDPSTPETFRTEVDSAIDELARNEAVASNGLQAEVAGQGPGLRVTLKDGRGAVVRQLTGEEFLRLREAATASRGRLLDKKL